MKENIDVNNLSKDLFTFANTEEKIHDKELETKPIGYFKDAFNRFKRNKGSLVAFGIISFLLLFAIVSPFLTKYTVKYSDTNYKYALPKSKLSEITGWDFWDGCKNEELNEQAFLQYYAIGVETNNSAIKNQKYTLSQKNINGKISDVYEVRLDSYRSIGVVYKTVTEEEYKSIQEYQDRTGIQIIYPATDKSKRPVLIQDQNNANIWYETTKKNGKTVVSLDNEGNYVNIYKAYTGRDGYTSSVRIEDNNEVLYDYSEPNQTGYKIRIDYYEYYNYYHSVVLNDGIGYASFIFGCNEKGKDIFACLGNGARFSFLLSIVVSSVNLIVGAIYGAIEGYYGGKVDIIMERIVEILSAVPMMIVITLLKYHMESNSQILIVFIAFFLTGWIGESGTVRMQFYRFKNQEYVLAARTLGAKDGRIMFKHIFPNALGTIVTSSVLAIPSVIFSETSLSYLGIINLETGNITSIGTLLSSGQSCLRTYPHVIVMPAIFICLLMLSFNLFGNGLRDAFNPTLRGSEE